MLVSGRNLKNWERTLKDPFEVGPWIRINPRVIHTRCKSGDQSARFHSTFHLAPVLIFCYITQRLNPLAPLLHRCCSTFVRDCSGAANASLRFWTRCTCRVSLSFSSVAMVIIPHHASCVDWQKQAKPWNHFEPSGSESHVLLLTFSLWLREKTVFDLHSSCKLEATKCLCRERNTKPQVKLYNGLFKKI